MLIHVVLLLPLLHMQLVFSETEIENISIKNKDFTYTVTWEPLKYNHGGSFTYTLYGTGLDDSGDERLVSGCVNITTNFCVIEEEFYTLVVPYLFRVVAIAGNEVLGSSQPLIYIPYEDENITVSPPIIQASRKGGNLTLRVSDIRVPWSDSLFGYLKEYDTSFEIDYFARSGNETHHIQMKLTEEEMTFLTSIPQTETLCVKVRLVLDFGIFFTYGEWAEKCLHGTVENSESPKTLFIAIAATAAFGLILSVLLIISCTKIGSKIYRHLFSVEDVHIPDDTLKVISSSNEYAFLNEPVELEKPTPIVLHQSNPDMKGKGTQNYEQIGNVLDDETMKNKPLLSVVFHPRLGSQENLLTQNILQGGREERELTPYVTVEEALLHGDDLGMGAMEGSMTNQSSERSISTIPEQVARVLPNTATQVKFVQSNITKKRLYSEDSAIDEDYLIPPISVPLRDTEQKKSISLDSDLGRTSHMLRSISENSIFSLDEGYVRMTLYEYPVTKVHKPKFRQTLWRPISP